MEHKQLNRIIATVVFAIAFVVYSMTVAPTTSYWDCGEFITSAYTMAVPHPPGAPLYILVGRIFSMIPFVQDIGLRVNMISVLVSALSAMFAYLIIVRLLRAWKGIPETVEQKLAMYTGGVIGALGCAFSDSIWFNAVEAEVYAMSLFSTAIVVWLIMVWLEKADQPVSDRIMLFIAYIMGLATGVHLLNILAIPTLFLIVYFKKAQLKLTSFAVWSIGAGLIFGLIYPGVVKGIPWIISEFSFTALGLIVFALLGGIVYAVRENKRSLTLVLMGMMLIGVGYSTYTALYIRSGLKPAINENHPDTPAKFVSYLNREQYGDIPIMERKAPMWEYQIKKMYIRYFGWQFIGQGNTRGADSYIVETISTRGLMALPFIIGLIGMFYHFKNDWKRASSILALFIMTGIAITIYLNQEDPQPRERDYAFVGSFFAFTLWIGIGAGAIMEFVLQTIRQSALLRKIGVAMTLVILTLAVPFNLLSANYHTHDRSGNYVAYDYSYNILQTCEADAVLFTNGDNDTFPLWFLQYVYNIRRDVRVVNLSLLNTNWYIKQLRDEEPKVPITFRDDQIDQLVAVLWEKPRNINIHVPRQTVLRDLERGLDNTKLTPEDIPADAAVSFELAHTRVIQGRSVLLTQDRMVLHIIAANKFERPIYFAVTVAGSNMLYLDGRRGQNKNYLRMDGLAFKIMPYYGPPNFMSPQHLQTNVFEKFRYRNLNNPGVFYNYNVQGLLQNYRSAFLRLINYYQTEERDQEKVLAVLDRINEDMPEEVIPLRDYRLSVNFGQIYADAGRPEELERRLDFILSSYNLRPVEQLMLGQLYWSELENPAKAESVAFAVMEKYPDFTQSRAWLASLYTQTREYEKGITELEKWLVKHPDDESAKQQIQQLKALASFDTSGRKIEAAPEADSTTNGTP
ncbi:MAG: DUF2723 domain-containing protein [Calditrichaeota bacterium]|nr:DUF2723 domain-containing protein [Calditrichota bacterium]